MRRPDRACVDSGAGAFGQAQTASHVLMIRPVRFLSNPDTAHSNAFQQADVGPDAAQEAGVIEFDAYVEALRRAGVGVTVVEDKNEPHTPDSIFPNNWISTHADGKVVLYPMEAPNRRLERRAGVLAILRQHFAIREIVDLSFFERDSCYLEGTGSMVLDREHGIAYACRSSRTHPDALSAFAALTGYRAHCFHAIDRRGVPIYHTNVMMCVGRTLAVVCMEAIADPAERALMAHSLRDTGKELIDITHAQMEAFAGNMLELRACDGHPVFALSCSAWRALTPTQRNMISCYARVALAPIETIERLGGGSARCMVAEVFSPPL